MSYILDALKKSEQERSRGTIPDFKTVHQPTGGVEKRSSARSYIVTVLLLLIASGLGYWIYDKTTQTKVVISGISNEGEFASTPSSPTDASAQMDIPPSKQTFAGQHLQQAAAANQQQLAHNLAELRDKAEQDESAKNASTSVSHHEEKPASVVHAKTSIKQAVHAASKTSRPNVIFSDKPLTSDTEPANGNPVTAKHAASVVSTPHSDIEQDDIYDIIDLPEDVKRNLPSISFAGHVYSSSKSQRSVMLNGKKMREGEELANGVVLDQITVDGVVLRSQGYRFKLGALQDWSSR